ncbi:aspartate kinase [Algicola sagamiensis]|uniref:aspartate kinase n=1 Tax=Algicola sagamiensis TaxID=163869 RepID=UPI0003781257|nr:aspartate kinase [Algicola sagamiensis]
MARIVQKYGGTSVGSIERIEAVAERVIRTCQAGHAVVVVVSAMAGETNRLIGLAHEVDAQPNRRELDVLASAGEQISSALLAMALIRRGHPAISLLADQVGIATNNRFGRARITHVATERLEEELEQGRVVIVAGYQGRDPDNNITTLGRGGTDTTAVAVAEALGADECQIFTDVDGVYTTDPRVISEARKLDQIAFDEMLEMASLGAKVLQIRAVEMAYTRQVPLRVLSSFDEGTGTLITNKESAMNQAVTGIACQKDEALITFVGVPFSPMMAAKILQPLGDADIEIDMVIQNPMANAQMDFSFTVQQNEFTRAMDVLTPHIESIGAQSIETNPNLVKLSLVGVGMKSHSGVAAKAFEALGHANIAIRLIATSEIKISMLIEEKYMTLGMQVLHDTFELEKAPKIAD